MSAAKKGLWSLAVLLLCFALYIHFRAANSSDKDWLLVAAAKLLSGRKLYIDIFEVNPPLIVWIYAIPVWLSRHFTLLSDYNFLTIMGAGAVAAAAVLSWSLLCLHEGFRGRPRLLAAFILWLVCVWVFLTAPMYFSDREHMLLVLTFPYVLRFMPGLARISFPLRLRTVIALLAAVGFCIKPHTLVIFVLLQLLYIFRQRSWAILYSMENLIIYALGTLYFLAIIFLMPEYLNTVLPMAFATYSAYSHKANGVYNIIVFLVILGITFADFRTKHRSPYRSDIYYFLAVCGGYLVYALLNNGWAYTYIPLLSMARILAGWVLCEFLWLKEEARAKDLPARSFDFGIRSCGLNLLLNVCFYFLGFAAYLLPGDCHKSMACRSTMTFFHETGEHPVPSFGVMSLEFYKWSELARTTGARWDTRFNHLWMLPKFLQSGPEFAVKHQWIIDYVGHAYADDLTRWKPQIVYVDSSPELFKGHGQVDIPAYLSEVPAFKEAWSRYHRTGVIDACVRPRKGAEPPETQMKVDCRFDIFSRTVGP